jgi:hypothetical protein
MKPHIINHVRFITCNTESTVVRLWLLSMVAGERCQEIAGDSVPGFWLSFSSFNGTVLADV